MDAGRVTGSFAAERDTPQRMQASSVFAALSPQMRHIAERVH
jgi:hypothetical protein